MKLWRCIICGEIFEGDEPPEICPVCGAPSEEFELYTEEKPVFTSDKKEKVVIIGNNAAGISAVEAIRKRNTDAEIIVIDKDPNYAYYRPSLSDYISDSHDEEYFYLHKKEWYSENNINLMLGTTVTKIDASNNQIILDNGEIVSYEKLILANGSHNFIPELSGINKKGVFSIKTLSDADEVKSYAKNSNKAAIIGGGLLGLEAAWELKKLGLDVTVIELADRLLPKQLDEESSKILEDGIKKTGININKSVTANAIIGEDEVTGIQLSNEMIIEADIVIVSIGVRANTKLAQEAGININRGIIVDEYMRTNINNIYGAGDVTEFNGINYYIWQQAIEQGEVAGANAVGDTLTYKNIIPNNVFNAMNMNIFSTGDLGSKKDLSYNSVNKQDGDKSIYKKLYFTGNKFTGGILIGDITKSSDMIKGVEEKTSLSQMVKEIIL
ncbi:FAD-dependent oxidoreductase [Vallitalea sp.]|uniref:FAD-dependent oxidoreductase n=1 Tax=Vallitalea sp. TaxID=1882829 RepID=UPI0025E47E0C|nr:FAD-dependent oxidoreductase [Vallitalea sp.]MCT4687887.1 FAD-dependent oxidoreductase [Vallitalea sp.]